MLTKISDSFIWNFSLGDSMSKKKSTNKSLFNPLIEVFAKLLVVKVSVTTLNSA